MRRSVYRIVILICFFNVLLSNSVFSWDNEVTHRDLSQFAAQNSILDKSRGDYLKNLGANTALNEIFVWNGKSWEVKKWLREGAFLEDAGSKADALLGKARFNNHFHNPLSSKPWSQAGLSDMQSGESAVLWAQDSAEQSVSVGKDWSWQTLRTLFYNALTEKTEAAKQGYYAQTFLGLGYQMHVIQDMSQPDHVRNDAHPIDALGWGGMETWAKKNYQTIISFASNTTTLVFPQVSLNTNVDGYLPISQFIDTNKYDGTSPSASLSWGLSEYTNSNFVSDHTIFTENTATTDKHYFPYPRYSSAVYEKYFVNASFGRKRIYLRKNGDGESIEHFATAGPLYKYLSFNPELQRKELKLDNAVHQDYSEKLIPRAVGYSAGLLNYFFRGQLQVIYVSGGIKVKNLSVEDMTAYIDSISGNPVGAIEIYYDDSSNERHPLQTYPLFTQSGSEITPIPLASGQSTDIISLPTLTDNIKANRYIVVFRGKLGNEEGAVIGKVALPPPVYYVATTVGGDKIYKIASDGTEQSVVYDNPDGYIIGKIDISPDGSTLALASSPDGLVDNSSIQLLDLLQTSATPTVLTNGNWPSWSPDGKKIAFEREVTHSPYSTDIEIFSINLETGAETQLTNVSGSSYSGQPAWSPNGNSIAYTKYGPTETGCLTGYVIYLMDASGSPAGPLTCPPAGEYMSVGDMEPSWSPEGNQIAFSRKPYVGQSYHLRKVNVSTKATSKLTDAPDTGYDELGSTWSSDGSSIALGSGRNGDFDIWLVDSSGSNLGNAYQTNLTDSNSGTDGYPVFGK